MATPDPLVEADVLLAYGRRTQALAVLRAALHARPDRTDIRERLNELHRTTLHAPSRQPSVVPHLLVALALFPASLGIVFGVPAVLINYRGGTLWSSRPEGFELLGFLAIFAIYIVAAAFVGVHGFLRLWFSYLRLLPSDSRNLVESRLPSVLNVSAMEPMYSRVRKRFFGDGNGT
jgi:hypothetical protein